MVVDAVADDAAMEGVIALFEAHHAEIYAYLYHMVGNQQWAQDLVQEAFVNVLKARRSLADVCNPRAWLYRIATNCALNALKRRRRFAWLPWQAVDREARGQSDMAENALRANMVQAALAALSPDLRAPLLLYAHYGLSVAEVAQALHMSEGAVKMRLLRARNQFRQVYEEGGGQ